jgi:RNA polymerase sigma-70 factor, ECF subfamily
MTEKIDKTVRAIGISLNPDVHSLRTIRRHIYVNTTTRGFRMSNNPGQNPIEAEHLAAARQGDSQHFSELTEPFRRELQVHCYRILGSLHEAEDMVQETMLRAWTRLETYEGRASFRAWLYKIATNACLDLLERRRSRRLLPAQAGPAARPGEPIALPSAEVLWLEPLPDEWLEDLSAVNPEARYSESESISIAFLTALQKLSPRQRAVLILRDVLDFSTVETAGVLDLTVSAVNSALHRARTALAGDYRRQDIPQRDERIQSLLDLFLKAWESADVDGLVALLKEDATLAMPPSPSWYQGRAAIRIFVSSTVFAEGGLFAGEAAQRWKLVQTQANGLPAFAIYQKIGTNEYQPFGIHVLNFEGNQLAQITSFIDPTLPGYFDLQKL